MAYLAALLAGGVGAVAVLLGVWLAQFLRDRHAGVERLESTFRTAESQLLLLLEAIDHNTGTLQKAWEEDFYAFTTSIKEIDSLFVRLRGQQWRKRNRVRFNNGRLAVEQFQERFGAATGKLRRGDSLSESEITSLSQGLPAADRRWRSDHGKYDPEAELRVFIEHVRYYMTDGVDAPAPD